jgi:hypothetical protein
MIFDSSDQTKKCEIPDLLAILYSEDAVRGRGPFSRIALVTGLGFGRVLEARNGQVRTEAAGGWIGGALFNGRSPDE